MKAIVNVKKTSAYARYNGLTFEVKEFLRKLITLDINGRTVDFSYNEVMVIDLQKELDKAFKNAKKKDYDSITIFRNIEEYIKYNNLRVFVDITLR